MIVTNQQRVAVLATCNLNQFAMDFDGNLSRVKESIAQARGHGCRYRVGPELEIPGYGCEDHFLEIDTVTHSWECIAALISEGYTEGLVVDVGAPVLHRGVRYNCRVFVLNGKVLLIRPKLYLANDGNYRETRWFSGWKHKRRIEDHQLAPSITAITGQSTAPFGDAVLQFPDATLAAETCEELFTPASPHIDLALAGVEIISNGSGSHHELRKLDRRLELLRAATAEAGGVYVYANQQGCDGGRLYYDGCSCIVVNGQVIAQGTQFSVKDVEVVTACIDLDTVTAKRGGFASFQEQASQTQPFPRVHVPDFHLCVENAVPTQSSLASSEIGHHHPVQVVQPEEEIARGPACWLWDYLRRSGASGFLLPLSGGADSSSTAAIVGCMCQMVMDAVHAGDAQVILDVRRIISCDDAHGDSTALPSSASELAHRLLTTVYMGTENSSRETRNRSKLLAEQIGSDHIDLSFDVAISAVLSVFSVLSGGRLPRFSAHGGSLTENVALQNVQARLRMVFAFLLAQLMPWVRGRNGFLLVLGSSNVDEALRGYLTKYDASSADINPIGAISKQDLRRFLRWAAVHLGYPVLAEVETAPPTAELEPLASDGAIAQTDEKDMGATYEELSMYGRLRLLGRCGPVSMFRALKVEWRDKGYPLHLIAEKVKHFFKYYAMNRHKSTTLTPSYHAEAYSPEDNRHDLRQFLYNAAWPWQFKRIDEMCVAHTQDVHS